MRISTHRGEAKPAPAYRPEPVRMTPEQRAKRLSALATWHTQQAEAARLRDDEDGADLHNRLARRCAQHLRDMSAPPAKGRG